jgi:hypothetical protein
MKFAAALKIWGGFWSLGLNGPMKRSDRVATLEEAKAQFQSKHPYRYPVEHCGLGRRSM